MKLLHLADLHKSRARFAEVEASLDVAEATAKREAVDLILLAGDLYDGAEQNSEIGLHDAFAERIQRLGDIAPVAIVEGTPTHDIPGSLDILARLACRYGITILRPGQAYFLEGGGISTRPEGAHALLFGIPEPAKKWLLANGGATGKDEATEAMRTAMRQLLLGLGAKRKAYPELPCILMYHGQVRGCKLSNGTTLPDGPVSRDDLAMVGFDYGALGDIHEPQQIPGIPAYYSGSIYSEWGEYHKPGCNLVEIDGDADGWARAITRIEFPHPQKRKIAMESGIPETTAYQGRQIWLEITLSKEDANDIDPGALLSEMLCYGALPGSRVTLNILPTETVRAGAIAEKTSLADKVQVWAENSSIAVPISALEKACELEATAAHSGAIGQGAHIRIDRLRLRGAIGIWKKSKKDEIDLDLEALGPGVLAMASPNGAGKTTVIENMHPWPCMLTRDGALKDHFRLRDSERDLYFRDERTGWKYRARILINAAIASGTAEYYLYRDTGSGYEPLPGINGRKEAYEAAIAELFGSLELYLRTAFVTQGPSRIAPDLAQATKGQRKALFAELAGIDYLERYREAAKARGDGLERELVGLDATIMAAGNVEAEIAEEKQAATIHREDEAKAKVDAEASLVRGRALKAEHEALGLRVAELDRQAARKAQLEREIAETEATLARIDAEITGFQTATGGRAAAVAELAKITDLEGRAAKLSDERAVIDKSNHEALLAYQRDAEALRTRQREAQAALDARRRELSETERSLAGLSARLSAPIADHCPTCAQLLPEEKRLHLQEERAKLQGEVDVAAAIRETRTTAVQVAEQILRNVTIPPAPEPIPFPGDGALAALQSDLAFLDADSQRETIKRADEAAVRIEEAERRRADAEGRKAENGAEIRLLVAALADSAESRSWLAQAERVLEAERAAYTTATNAVASAKASAEAAEKSLAQARERAKKRDEAKAKRDEIALERDDWRLLERATGPDGIQALELDALAPSIAAVSNRLLGEAYGSRYQIEFRTTRIAGKGSKTKQVEDFEIFILDTETGDEQEIATLSGGEAVWIRKALYDGFAIIRAQNTGTKFQTVFLDEADGALDPEARMLYLRMLEAAHREAGRYQTILISHSTEIQAMVEQIIDVSKLGPRVEATAGGVAA